jgi:hypothetical protein
LKVGGRYEDIFLKSKGEFLGRGGNHDELMSFGMGKNCMRMRYLKSKSFGESFYDKKALRELLMIRNL